MFRHEGWKVVETGGHGEPDGGVDLRITRGSERRLVQCKRWTAYSVGVDEVRKLGGSLLAEGLGGDAGMLVTTSEFTKAATKEAKRLQLELIDGAALVPKLVAAGATHVRELAERPRTPWACPNCGSRMILDRSTHGWWLRCPAYRIGCDGKWNLDSDAEQALELLRRAS